MTTLQTNLDLCAIIERHAPTRLQHIATTGGGEFCGPCPWCGGNDRFRVWPNATKPHWWCRGCLRGGDAIAFIMEWLGLSYHEACAELDLEPGEQYVTNRLPLAQEDSPPPQRWQDMAEVIIQMAQRYLWSSSQGQNALAYLLKRGLTESTIKAAHLGYFPLAQDGRWYNRPFSDWGLTDALLTDSQRQKGCVRIPDGILMPWYADNNVWKLTVKRFAATKEGELKYGQILGSRECLYNADAIISGIPVLVSEAVIDALSAQQEAGSTIQLASVATDSITGCRTSRWIARLASSPLQLIAFDNDDNQAGNRAASFWTSTLSSTATRWSPLSHDINDMLIEGRNIKQWLALGLQLATSPLEIAPTPQTTPPAGQAPVLLPAEPFASWLARLEQELGALPTEPEQWCIMCDADMAEYSDDMQPLCASCYQAYQQQSQPIQTIEQFVQHVAGIGTHIFDCTVSIIPQGYTLAQHVAMLNQSSPKQATWNDYRKTRA